MGAMTVANHAAIPTGRPFTVADLEAMPDDGNRYELIDGMLVVSPAPSWGHQEMGLTAYVVLREKCPRAYRVMGAPFALQTAFDSEVRPDVLVTRYTDLTPKNHRPLAQVVGDDAFDAELPFPVRIVPARLLDGLRP